MDYSEEDAENDSRLLLCEVEDFSINWLGNFNPSLIQRKGYNKQLNQEHALMIRMMSSHLKNLRYLKFAEEAIDCEKHRLNNTVTLHTTFNQLLQNETIKICCNEASFQDKFPFTIAVSEIVGIEQMLQPNETLELKMRQLKKDIERDRLLINGQRVVGSEEGLDRVLEMVGGIADELLVASDLLPLHPLTRDELALALACKASRTHSGGVCFQAAQSTLDPSLSMLLPLSTLAPPIALSLAMGAFPDTPSPQGGKGGGLWGLVCRVSCESLFEVKDHLASREDVLMEGGQGQERGGVFIKCLYEDFVLLEGVHCMKKKREEGEGEDEIISSDLIIGREIDSGTVTLSLYHPTNYFHS